MSQLEEPWLRGPLPGVHPALAPALYVFQQTREDLAKHTPGLTDAGVWARPYGLPPLGFHLQHIAGSVDRLTTYLQNRVLDARQSRALSEEVSGEASLPELLMAIDRALAASEAVIRQIHPETFGEARWVGRKRLPVTVIGLVTHIAEHTERHLGQAISAAKLARAISSPR